MASHTSYGTILVKMASVRLTSRTLKGGARYIYSLKTFLHLQLLARVIRSGAVYAPSHHRVVSNRMDRYIVQLG